MRRSLRDYQQEALDTYRAELAASNGRLKGRFVYPTGAGKTFIESAILATRLQQGPSNIHLVAAPRIVLLNQLIAEYRRGVLDISDGLFRAIAFHSGSYEARDDDYEHIYWDEKNTTSAAEVVAEIENASLDGLDLVVFSTYHSMGRLSELAFDTFIADESQFLVQTNFNQSLRLVNAPVQLFFTATERHTASENGFGLNNEKVYGKRLGYVTPSKLIEDGHIVPPRVHVMEAVTDNEDNVVIDTVVQAATAQHRLTADGVGKSKILFAMRGTEEVKIVEDRIDRLRAAFPSYALFTITSRDGAKIDGVEVDRDEFLEQLRTSEEAIICHYDILSEGIDVDGITGVVLMRNMQQSKLLQTIGRAIRTYKPDPSKKPYAWITIPVINGDDDSKVRVVEFCRAMIYETGFDIDLSKEIVIDTRDPVHSGDPEELGSDYLEPRLGNGLGILEEVKHSIDVLQRNNQLLRVSDDDFLDLEIS